MSDDADVEIAFPVEFVIPGTPVSFQAANKKRKNEWKEAVAASAREVVPEFKWLSSDELSILIYDFPEHDPEGDVDNIVKLIQDSLCSLVYEDDRQIMRVVAQRFRPQDIDFFDEDMPDTFARALALGNPPFVFVKIDSSPLEDAQ